MPIIIMAGGRGERLLPITKKLPKPLIKIGSTPMIFNLINQIYNQDITTFMFHKFYEKPNEKKLAN